MLQHFGPVVPYPQGENMTMHLSAEIQCDESYTSDDDSPGELHGMSYDGEITVRITNDAAENGGAQEPGPLTWLNSARITTDPESDSVHCLVSIGDPRGAFCFTVRRCPDGRIVLYLPYPGDTMPHEKTVELHAGTLQVVGDDGTPIDFADPEDEEDEDEDEEL